MADEDILLDADFLKGLLKGIPNLKLPDPELIDTYKYSKDRIIWIEGTIDEDTLDVVRKIMYYNRKDFGRPVEERLPIKIILDTNGGSVSVMWTLIQAIKISKTPIWTINLCDCLSAGAHILASGHKRFGFPGSTVLVHSGSCSFAGTMEQADNAKKYYETIGKLADEQLLTDTKIDKKVFKKKAPFDWYITDKEALEYGIIDEIISDFDVLFGTRPDLNELDELD